MPSRIGLGDAERVELGRADSGPSHHWQRRDGGKTVVVALDDRQASQHHAVLVRDGNVWHLHDLESKNGTRHNGNRVTEAVVAAGDTVEVGGTFAVLRHAGGDDLVEPIGPHPLLRTLSASFARDIETLARIAKASVSVLVRGDTGTGKEIVARAIHEMSGRRGPFVAINCAAITPTLVASELFGVRRGAYSGATEDRVGLVRTADRGTLFLDEIAELGAESQAALLRVLQEGQVVPVGATQPIAVDVRIVAATHQPLDELAAAGRFRRDLLSRLRGYQCLLPPLADRREDLGLLVAVLLDQIAPGRAWTFRRAAARALVQHDWPLHVRELEQALRAATAVADGDEITLDDLPATIMAEAAATDAPEPPDQLAKLVTLVALHKGNVSKIAEAMATSRSHVRRLVQRFSIDLVDARKR